jgi:tRNA modification GTPase
MPENRMATTSQTVALMTPRGRGAVATVRVRGDLSLVDSEPNRLFHAVNGKTLNDQTIGRICFGHWGRISAEEVVACRVDPQTAEFHCHGGDAAVQRILDDLVKAGHAIQSWTDMCTDANGLLASECSHAVAQATTLRTASYLLEQQAGTLRTAYDDLLQTLHPDSESKTNSAFRIAPKTRRETIKKLDELLQWAAFGLHLTQPWSVVIAGRPNVGKSSLINALVGYSRAIVYDQPGTTRDVVTAETVFEGWPIRFADTAGMRETPNALEKAGIERARQQLQSADCIVLLIDASRPCNEMDRRLLSMWPSAVCIAHKSDLPSVATDEMPSAAISVSSVTGEGLDELIDTLMKTLVPSIPAQGTPVPISERQVACLKAAHAAAESHDVRTCRVALTALFSTRYHEELPSSRRQ